MSDWRERLDELAALEPGWLDGEGEALPSGGKEWALVSLAPVLDEYPGVLLSLTDVGELQAEWHWSPWYPSFTVDTNAGRAYYHTCNIRDMTACEDDSMDMLSESGRESMMRLLARDAARAGKVAP